MGMMGGATAGLGLGQQWANNPNLGAPSWVQNGLSTLDPLGNQITQMGGDPLNLYGNKNNPNALLFPTNPNANGANSQTNLPNLGAQSMIPTMPGGSFGAANLGTGPFNDMANQSAGQIFTPSGIQAPISQPNPVTSLGGTKPSINTGGTQYSPNALPGGGGNPALGSPSGSALSRSQISGGNVGPTGVTERGDPAFLNNLHNGMMQYLKAQGNLPKLPNGGGGYNRNGGPR